jgi:ribosomal protein S18 acetylase RimI-like enzyme
MTVHIGPLVPGHAGEALTVQRAAFVVEAQQYNAPRIPPLTETVDELRADLEVSPAVGAWLGSRLAGHVRGRVTGDRMQVLRFAVAPDLQGKGIGSALLSAVEAAAPPEVRTFWLMAGASSAANLRLYGRTGYAVVGETTDEAGVGLLVMEKTRSD